MTNICLSQMIVPIPFELSMISYCRSDFIRDWNCGILCAKHHMKNRWMYSDQKTNAFGYVGFINHSMYITFRGTESDNLKNWFYNIQFVMSKFPCGNLSECYVHSGFLKTYSSIAHKIFDDHKKYFSDPHIKVVVSGHSLGGAMATLFAYDLFQNFQKQSELYTFGSPRVGNIDFFVQMNRTGISHQRYVNRRDPVPHIPPNFFDYYYIHHPTEFWIVSDPHSDDFYVKICDHHNEKESDECSNSLRIPYSVSDHTNYFDSNDFDYMCVN